MVEKKHSPQLDADEEGHLPPSREKVLALPGEEPRLRRIIDLTIKESLALAAYRRVNRSPPLTELVKNAPPMEVVDRLVEIYKKDDEEFPEEHAFNRLELAAKIDFATSTGERIRSIRQYLQMDQSEFAVLLDVKQGTISKWENDKSIPPDDILEKLAAICDATHASYLRYGPREYTSAGELVPELPVLVIGELNERGHISKYATSETRATERPREGRPYKDVIAVDVRTLLPGAWMGIDEFFFRYSWHLDPAKCVGRLCVMKVQDFDNLWVGYIYKKFGEHYIVMTATACVVNTEDAEIRIEWATPILSMRQDVPFMPPFEDGPDL